MLSFVMVYFDGIFVIIPVLFTSYISMSTFNLNKLSLQNILLSNSFVTIVLLNSNVNTHK